MTITLWHIWEARNGISQLHPYCIAEKIKAYAGMALLHLHTPKESKRCDPTKPKRWDPLLEGWVMINVDATVFVETNQVGIGLVIRDYNGNFLAACRRGVDRITEPDCGGNC
uniref:RNase H type-1 domain-containing protein n=1 Tax=Arundo donax TaxID=35708 RepID=A0A0A9H5A6_ARUDO